MAKVFTITEGLENLGAMRTGGQGSVYKGRRIGEIITAIKLLPTPICSESEDDKNFVDFKNEVQKLKKVNEHPNPNVVKILSSGITDTGNFPFIEMEYIDGPDLEELLKPPHDPVFTIKETLKVADQLSNAIAHCHKVGVRHCDIKSNNVKFNAHTGNYVLLDFGLAVMSDEQRRSSLRHAGAIEFMAPEQNEGQMLFQTDVYSFGIILFELLAGTVPFPLHDKGETARNNVRLSHMETPPPDLLSLRRNALPTNWSAEKKAHEMNVPDWLINVIYKCLEKKSTDRFANGMQLHEHIVLNSVHSEAGAETRLKQTETFVSNNSSLQQETEQLQQMILQYKQQLTNRNKEIEELNARINNKDKELELLQQKTAAQSTYTNKERKGVSRAAFVVLLLLTLGLAAFAAYTFLGANNKSSTSLSNNTFSTDTSTPVQNVPTGSDTVDNQANVKPTNDLPAAQPAAQQDVQAAERNNTKSTADTTAKPVEDSYKESNNTTADRGDQNNQDNNTPDFIGQYKVVAKAYFYSEPDEGSRRNAYIVPANNPIVKAMDEQDGFVYVLFTTIDGRSMQGWLRKSDLSRIQ